MSTWFLLPMAHAWRSRVAWRIRWLSALNVVSFYALWGTMASVEDWSRHFILPWIFLIALASAIVLPFCIIASLTSKHAASFGASERLAAVDGCLLAAPQRRVAIFASWVLAGSAPWLSALVIHLPLVPALALLSLGTIGEALACAAWLGALVVHFTTWSLLFSRVYPLKSIPVVSEKSNASHASEVAHFLRALWIGTFAGLPCVVLLVLPAMGPFLGTAMGFWWKDSFLISSGMALLLTLLAFCLASRGLSRGQAPPSLQVAPTRISRGRRRWRWVFSLTRRFLAHHPLVWFGLTRSWGKFGPLRAMTPRGDDADPGLRALPITPSQVVTSEVILLLVRTLILVVGGFVPGGMALFFVEEGLLFWKYWMAGLTLLPFIPLAALAAEIFIVSAGRWKIRLGLFAVVIGAFLLGLAGFTGFDDMNHGMAFFTCRMLLAQTGILLGLVFLMLPILDAGAKESASTSVAPGLSLEDVAPIGGRGRGAARLGFFGGLLRVVGVVLVLLMVTSFIVRWRLNSQVADAERAWRRRGWPPTNEELFRWRPMPPEAENAAVAFRHAAGFVCRVPLPGQVSGTVSRGGTRPIPTTNDYLRIRRSLLENNQEALRLAAIASRLTETRASGSDPSRWLSHIMTYRQVLPLREILHSTVMAQMAAGVHHDALDAMDSLLAFSRALRADPILPWANWRYNWTGWGMNDAGVMLSLYSLTDSELDRLRFMVAKDDLDQGLEDSLIGSLVFRNEPDYREFTRLWRPRPPSVALQERLEAIGECSKFGFGQLAGYPQRYRLAALRAGFEIHEILKQSPLSRKERFRHIEESLREGYPAYFVYIYNAWAIAHTRQAALLTAIAVEKFRLRVGRLPERLDELVPLELAQVPPDPVDDQPLRYRKLERGYVVYGLGGDGEDGGGVEENQSGVFAYPSSQPDVVVKIER